MDHHLRAGWDREKKVEMEVGVPNSPPKSTPPQGSQPALHHLQTNKCLPVRIFCLSTFEAFFARSLTGIDTWISV